MTEDPLPGSLGTLEDELAKILGSDLAASLIGAARADGAWGLDLHLAVNDGLERLDPDTRARALALVDRLLARTGDSGRDVPPQPAATFRKDS